MNIYLIVFIIYFGIIIATSIVGAKKVESMEDFAVGGNKMGLILGIGTSMGNLAVCCFCYGCSWQHLLKRRMRHHRMGCGLVLRDRADACYRVQNQKTGSSLPYLPGIHSSAV